MLSPGADAFTRLPKPLEKPELTVESCLDKGLGSRAKAAVAGFCGFAAMMSSSVDAPTSIAPLSGSTEGAVVKPISSTFVVLVPTFVAALPPDGPIAGRS
jgi:hypothetical protein